MFVTLSKRIWPAKQAVKPSWDVPVGCPSPILKTAGSVVNIETRTMAWRLS